MGTLDKPAREQLRVPAHVDYLREIRDFVAKAARKHRCDDRVVNALRYAVEEAAANVIKHAYRDGRGTITIGVHVYHDKVNLIVIDQGRYFDPRRVRDPNLREYVAEGKRGGLGIFIIRKLVDEIDYRKTPEGNQLRLTKYRDAHPKKRLTIPGIPTGLKVKYSLVASAAITVAVLIAYLLKFSSVDDQIIAQSISRGTDVCVPVANSVGAAVADADNPTAAKLAAGIALKSALKGWEDFVLKAFVVDSANNILFSTRLVEMGTEYRLPPSYTAAGENALIYRLPDGSEIFDISTPVRIRDEAKPFGYAHIWIDKAEANAAIRAARMSQLRSYLMLLAIAYAGVFLLVYLVTSPLRKLAYWVREAGRAGAEEELDIDETSEVGEIARAFSDITHRLRESEASLVDKERLDREVQLAREIQQTLLPSEFPKIEGYEIGAFYEAAKEVGGDYYDFVEVDKDVYGVAIADVSGKGIPGSLVMTMIRTALRTESRGVLNAADVLRKVNDFVIRDMKKGMFVTIFYAILDTRRRRLCYASAGHNPMILYRGRTRKTYYLNPKGFPIGLDLPDPSLFAKSIESETIRLSEDDILILYTDGITEAMNSRRQLFGEERLLQVVRDYGHLPVDGFIEKLKDELHSFTEGMPQNDDITLVALKERMTPEKVEFNRAREAHRLILSGRSIREACELAGITTYAYYTRYKKLFETTAADESGMEDEATSIEAKHLSIEEKVKIYDVILRHPEYGAKRISEELKTERYGFTDISESKIYEELVRARLNTRRMREAYASRNAHKGRPKPPGTPLLTLDGRPLLDQGPAGIESGVPTGEEAEPVTAGTAKGEESGADAAGAEFAEEFLSAYLEEDEELNEAIHPDLTASVAGPSGEGEEEPPTGEAGGLPVADSFAEFLEEEEEEEIADLPAGAEADVVSSGAETEGSETTESDEHVEPAAGAPVEREGDDEFPDLDVLASVEEILSKQLEEEPENGHDEESAPPRGEAMVSFVDLMRSIEEELSYIAEAPGEKTEVTGQAGPAQEPPEDGRRVPTAGTDRSEGEKDKRHHLVRGIRHYRSKNYEKAIEEFAKVVEEYPDYKEAWSILGNAYYRAGKYKEATRAYERVKRLDPLDTDAYENLGVIYANEGRYERAIEEWQKILKIDPARKDILYHIQKAKRLMSRG